jgi:hypothetical protein
MLLGYALVKLTYFMGLADHCKRGVCTGLCVFFNQTIVMFIFGRSFLPQWFFAEAMLVEGQDSSTN